MSSLARMREWQRGSLPWTALLDAIWGGFMTAGAAMLPVHLKGEKAPPFETLATSFLFGSVLGWSLGMAIRSHAFEKQWATSRALGGLGALGIIRRCPRKDIDPKRPAHVWCLYSRKKPRRLLGRHTSRKEALRQERAIWVRRRG